MDLEIVMQGHQEEEGEGWMGDVNRCDHIWGFRAALMVKSLPVSAGNAREMGLIPGFGRPPAVGNSNPLQYSCLENPMDRGA